MYENMDAASDKNDDSKNKDDATSDLTIAATSLNNVDDDREFKDEFYLKKQELDDETTIKEAEKLDWGESEDNGGDEDGDHEDGHNLNRSRYYWYSIQRATMAPAYA